MSATESLDAGGLDVSDEPATERPTVGRDGGFRAGVDPDGRRIHRLSEDHFARHRVAQHEIDKHRRTVGSLLAIIASPRHGFLGRPHLGSPIFECLPRFFAHVFTGSTHQ